MIRRWLTVTGGLTAVTITLAAAFLILKHGVIANVLAAAGAGFLVFLGIAAGEAVLVRLGTGRWPSAEN